MKMAPGGWRPSRSSIRDLIVVMVLAYTAVRLNSHDLGPSSLWLDETWVALVHRAPYSSVLDMSVTAPGFGLMTKLWYDIVGFSELRAQIPAFVAAAIAGPLMFLMLRRRVCSPIALAAGFLVVLSPMAIAEAVAVKQYNLEVVVAILVIWAGLRALERPSTIGPLRVLAGTASVAVVFSFTLVMLVAATVATVFVVRLRAIHGEHSRITWQLAAPTTAWTAVPAVVAVGLFVVDIRPRLDPNLVDYWADFYIKTDNGRRAVLTSSRHLLHEMATALTALPQGLLVAWFIVVVVLALRRPALFAITVSPLLLTMALSAMEKLPLGGGRTDLHLLAPLVAAGAFGAEELRKLLMTHISHRAVRVSLAGVVAAACTVALLVAATRLDPLNYPYPYPQEDLRPLAELMDEQRGPDDVVIVYYSSRWAYALYSDEKFDVATDLSPYRVIFESDRVIGQANYRDEPDKFMQYAREADAKGGRIWLIGSHLFPDWWVMIDQIQSQLGRPIIGQWERPGAQLVLFDG